jgi:hypothetical protein
LARSQCCETTTCERHTHHCARFVVRPVDVGSIYGDAEAYIVLARDECDWFATRYLCLAKTRSAATDVSVMVTTTANQWAGACVCSPESHRGLLPANRELAANPGGQISATVARLSTGCHSGGEARVAVVQTTDF